MMRALYTLRVRPLTPVEVAHARAVVEEQAPDVLDYFFPEETA